MTTTQVAPDLTITTGPTQSDAQIVLQLAALSQSPRQDEGGRLLWATEQPLTFEEFTTRHPRGSESRSAIMSVMAWYETIGTLVKQGLLNRDLVYDWLWVSGTWDRAKAIALGERAETIPQMWENFEALAEGQRTADTT